MACIGVCSGSNRAGIRDPVWEWNRIGFAAAGPKRVGWKSKGNSGARITAAAAAAGQQMSRRGEKFDRWMSDSVVEIVKNLRQAPLFVHVYGGDDSTTRVKTERALADEWPATATRWRQGEEEAPEGVILVEELKDGEGNREEEEGQNGESTKAWGVVIQGKGEEGGVGCYLLKTSRGGGSEVMGLATHFCLVRVKSFRESAASQLKNCWLVQSP